MKRLLPLCLLLSSCAVVVIPQQNGSYEALSRPGGSAFDRQRQVANRARSVCDDQNRMVAAEGDPKDVHLGDGGKVQTKLIFHCVDRPAPAPKQPEG